MKTNKVLAISVIVILMLGASGLVYSNVSARPYSAATAPSLGAAGSFSALASSAATSAGGVTTLQGDLGLSTGDASSRTGDWNVGGSEYFTATSLAGNANSDALGAYNNLAGQGSDGTWSLVNNPAPGVWTTASSATFADTLTLNGSYEDVWVFQIGASLTFSGSVVMGGDAQACHVFWQVGEDTTIASGSSFVGTLISENNISLLTGATVSGRVISLVGALTTDNNTINMPPCTAAPAAGPSLPDNPQPESGSTEAYVGTQTALTATAVSSRAGVPSTGGAPLQGAGTLWFIIGFGVLSVAILFYITRKVNRNNGPK